MRVRKKIDVFSLSFLDCICCGFGAVILLFVIINARSESTRNEVTSDLRAEASRLAHEVEEGERHLFELKNTIEETDEETVETQGLSRRLMEEIKEVEEQLANMSKTTLAQQEHLNKLKSDLKSADEDVKRLKAGSEEDDDSGQSIRKFQGDGDRQYLTGVKVGGKRIAIMVDASASMLDDTVVGVIRRRNESDEIKRQSEKWQRAVRTVDWLTTQIPAGAQVQLFTFNEKPERLGPAEKGDWLDGSDPELVNDLIDKLKTVIPEKGTSLQNAYEALGKMEPRPDNVFLLTDGLPTMGSKPGRRKTVSERARIKFFDVAESLRPKTIPFNVILFPMEGDPTAGKAFWVVAQRSKGSFFCPSKDWP